MPVDPQLYFDLSLDEIREVTRFSLAPAEQSLTLLRRPPDPRVTAALGAARRFVDGDPRSKLLRVTALDAHRASADAEDAVSRHVAAAAGDASASAYLHPFAKGNQVGHILRSTVHAALAAEATGEDPAAAKTVLDDATRRGTPVLLDVLRRYPHFPGGRSRVTRMVCELDLALRQMLLAAVERFMRFCDCS